MDLRRPPRLTGARASVGLTLVVAVLSILTGAVSMGLGAGGPGSPVPLAEYLPQVASRAAGFTGALTGFLMLGSALGLRRGLRSAWYSTVLLLPATALQGLVQQSQYSLPLVVLSLVALPVVGFSRRHFERRVALTPTQIAALAAIVGTQLYGTVGAYVLREQFRGVETLLDAFYYALVTASTVGYGDAVPAGDDPVARLFGLSVVVLGTTTFAVALGAVFGPLIEARLANALGKMTESELELLEDHVLVLGYGELTESILDELIGESPYLVVMPEGPRAAELADRDVDVLTGDPSDEDVLRRAGIAEARAVLAATNDDAEDALAILTARQLNPDLPVVAAATDRDNVEKLRRAGADTVISPAAIGGHLLVQSALGRSGMEAIADRILAVEDADEPVDAADEGEDHGEGERRDEDGVR